MITTPSPFLKWTPAESDAAHDEWGANCGPHSLAAALGKSLTEVRPHIGDFKGWMSPTMIERALRSMEVNFHPAKNICTPLLCNGLNRIQWHGKWLNPGVPARVAYRHTHWVAHSNGWVLCTACDPYAWQLDQVWRAWLSCHQPPWHVTHHYFLTGCLI